MSIADHVVIQVVADSLGVPLAGFGVPMILSCNASFPERTRTYNDTAGIAEDFATTSPEYLAGRAVFSQSPHPEELIIGRAVGQPTQAYRIDISAVTLGATYGINVVGQGVTATEVRYTTLVDITFVDGDVTVGTDTIAEVAHGMTTGAGPFRVSNSGGALPTGLAVDTNYWIIAPTADTYKFASSKANALALTAVDITAAAGGGTHTLRRNQNDVICAQLEQGVNAVVGNNYIAAQVPGAGETDHLTVTADTAGGWFSLEVTNVALIKIAQTHVEPATTFATDLTNIANENDTWYALYTLYNSEPCVKAVAADIEGRKKLYIADLSQSETVTLASAGTGSSDVADDLAFLEYDRTATVYHPSPASMCGAAWLGTRLPFQPGSETWKFAAPSGVAAVTLTSTHKTNLRAKNCNVLQSIGGTSRMWEGKVVSGEFIDIIRGIDWQIDDMQVRVYNSISGANRGGRKLALNDGGIAVIENDVKESLELGQQNGLVDTFEVTVPKAANISTANKAARTLPDVKFQFTVQGAIHKVAPITGVVSV